MTVLSLEDSKALYDAGIKIETKKAYYEFTEIKEEPITSYLNKRTEHTKYELYDRNNNPDVIPAPDLEELLEYTKRIAKKYDKSLLAIAWSEHNTGKDKWWADLEGCRVADGTFADSPIKALANLLLKLKEEGYEV
jgi:hypothetical protein